MVIVIYTTLGVLTYEGVQAPWSPVMTAWSGDPVPVNLVEGRTPLELQGAAVFRAEIAATATPSKGSAVAAALT